MVDAIHIMFCDCYYKYSSFLFPLFIGVGVEVDGGLEFAANPINGISKSIDMDVGVDGGKNL
jgi:hypothetical protein